MRRVLVATALLGLLAGAGVLMLASARAADKEEKDIVDTAVGAGNFKTLVEAVKEAGLVDTVERKGAFHHVRSHR